MQNEILIYILYAMAVITVILAFKRYELQYHLTDYVYPHCPSKKLRILKFLDAFNTVMTILASAVPIKFRYYEKEDLFSVYFTLQVILLIATYRNISDFKRLVFSKYFLTAVENQNKGSKPPDTPWFNIEFSTLNSNKKLDNALIKYISESIEYYKQSLIRKR